MRPRTRWGLALVSAGVALAVTTATFIVASEDEQEPTAPSLTPEQARTAATASCRHIARFEDLIDDDAGTRAVLEALARAEQDAERAAAGDPIWVALASGVQSIRVALDTDSPGAARIGIDVVRTECRRTT